MDEGGYARNMIPAYQVPPEDIMEIAYAVSQVGPDASSEEIQKFTNFSERKVYESLKLLKELEIVRGEDSYSITHSYRKKIDDVSIQDRNALLNRGLIQYRPFRTFGSYLRKGYPAEDAARKTNVVHEVASDPQYIISYFKKLGEYTGIVDESEDGIEITVEDREIPIDSVESVEALRNAMESEAEIRFWMEETIGSEIISNIDEDTENELVKSFTDHAESPRDSITASGRALEDFLREVGRANGVSAEKIENSSGAGQLAQVLREESVIREVQGKRAKSLSSIRNKGGAHGDDRQTGERWRTEAELALTVAMETTLLVASISEHVDNGNQVL